MKAKLVFLAVILFCAAGFSYAAPDGEKSITSTSGWRMVSVSAVGTGLVECLAIGGTATIVLVDSEDGVGAAPNTHKRKWPDNTYGDTTFFLQQDIPRPFFTSSTGVDSVLVVLTGATKVIVTWTND